MRHAALVLGVLLGASAVAEADGDPDRIHFPTHECTSEFEVHLWRQGVARSQLDDTDLSIDVQTVDGVLSGRLTLEQGERVLRGQTCSEIARALALIVAMSVTGAAEDPPVMPRQAIVEPPEQDVIAVIRAAPSAPKAARPAREGRTNLAVGLGLLANEGVLPEAQVALVGALEVRRRSGAFVRLALHREDARTEGTPGADFSLRSGQIQLCPAGWGRRLQWTACALGEAGVLQASGLQAMETRSVRRLWLAAGAMGLLRYHLGGRVNADLSLGAVLPLRRDHFYFEPDASVHRVRAAVLTSTISLGVKIW